MNEPTERSPGEQLMDLFIEHTGVSWPQEKDIVPKWLEPLKAISERANGDLYQREQAIIEAIAKCQNDGRLVATPRSIESTALQLLRTWQSFKRHDPTEQEFINYRNRVKALGYTVIW
jgi:hypothetical protein